MKTARIIAVSTAALTLVTSAALAQQAPTAIVTMVDRINGTIVVKQTPSGTVGANAGGAVEEFKPQDGALLNTLHAGDRVTVTYSDVGGVKKITKLQKQ
jgi:Cu/Ag efflux protein CusF